jgi:hypothetical protein
VKTKTELEPKAKHPVSIFVPLTFPGIAASIEKSQVRLIYDFLPLAIETIRIFNDMKYLCKKNLKTIQTKCEFFLIARYARRQQHCRADFRRNKKRRAATKITTAGCTATQNKRHVL